MLDTQYDLDDFFVDLPEGHETDLESVDAVNGRLWLCGSHCRVRREPDVPGVLDPGFRRRPSRHLLGSIELNGSGKPKKGTGTALPYTGEAVCDAYYAQTRFCPPFSISRARRTASISRA
ncbi:DUF3616 domain-containing protein [Mesorhizobium sp. M0578]|uniref:DUF3616 domain-containing protein n=1 Tax=unclassified Mesorhizobium TaxID=325217 RepID=UPI003338062F